MKLIAIAILAASLYAQEPKAESPKPDPRDQKIQWLEKKVQLLEEKIRGLIQFYGADEQLMQLEQQKPIPLKEVPKQ